METATSLTIKDTETVGMINRLARESGSTAEQVVRRAMAAEAEREERVRHYMERLRVLQDRYASWPDRGLKADKAFFDDLGGEL